MAGKLPALMFYTSDWLREPTLRLVSLAARGLWIDMLCIMSESDPRGFLVLNKKPLNGEQLARLTGGDSEKVESLLGELENSGVFSRDRKGVIFSRRIVRDEQERNKSRAHGFRGGNPKLGVNYNHPGYVYLMKRSDGAIKIGISSSPEKRASALRKNLRDHGIAIVHKSFTLDMGKAENDLHVEFASSKIEGEWFRISDETVKTLILRLKANEDVPLNANSRTRPRTRAENASETEDEDEDSSERGAGKTVRESSRRAFDQWSSVSRGGPIREHENEVRHIFDLISSLAQGAPVVRGSEEIPAELFVAQATEMLKVEGAEFRTIQYACKSVRNRVEKWIREGPPGNAGKSTDSTKHDKSIAALEAAMREK